MKQLSGERGRATQGIGTVRFEAEEEERGGSALNRCRPEARVRRCLGLDGSLLQVGDTALGCFSGRRDARFCVRASSVTALLL